MSNATRYAYRWEDKAFSEEVWQDVQAIIDQQKGEPGALIPVLEAVQDVTGYLPESVLRCVASGLGLPLSQVYGVATFYAYFTLKPRGRHQVRLCLGTACHVRGAQRNLDVLQERLRLEPGECTPDGEFGLEVVRCLGACGLAPVMMVDADTHRQVRATGVGEIVASYSDEDATSEREGA